MSLNEFMLYWQNNWQLGMGICTFIVLAVYITTSVCILIKTRKIGFDICMSAMIPIINILILFGCLIKRRLEEGKERKMASQNFSDENEIDLW